MATPQPERRRSPRFPYDGALEIEWGSSSLKVRVRDISTDGMMVETDDPLWIGARFAARLTLDPPLEIDAVVRRIVPGSGMGISFTIPVAEDRVRLTALLQDLRNR